MATITKVTYRKTYNLGSFQSEAIGVEMELNENEDPLTAFREMNKLTDEYHAETLSSLEQFRGTNITPLNEVKEIRVDKKTDAKRSMIEAIKGCSDVLVLKTFEKLAKSNPDFQQAYDETMAKLTNKQ